ncbi:MAG: NADH-quinone oxidoreductase subunit A [Chloroflexi bacterium]|nr:NADH-quinone oxidoreductase subunit A [Chloroflexota bacterium]
MPASEYAVNYSAVAIAAIFGAGAVVLAFILSRILAPRGNSPEKSSPYECGMAPIGQYWSQLHVRYYLFAILFLIFDVEAVFLFPWAAIFAEGSAAIFYEMIIFIAILFFGLIYGWKKGILQWWK